MGSIILHHNLSRGKIMKHDVDCPIKGMCLIFETVKTFERYEEENEVAATMVVQQKEVFKGFCGTCHNAHNRVKDFLVGFSDETRQD